MKVLKKNDTWLRAMRRALAILLLLLVFGLAMTVLAVVDLARLGGKEAWSD